MTHVSVCHHKWFPANQPIPGACLTGIYMTVNHLTIITRHRKPFATHGNVPIGGDARKQFFISYKPKRLPLTR